MKVLLTVPHSISLPFTFGPLPEFLTEALHLGAAPVGRINIMNSQRCGLPCSCISLRCVCMACRLGQILVFSKIRAALGIMSTIISGGGSLAAHLDDFYEVLLLAYPERIFQYPSKSLSHVA